MSDKGDNGDNPDGTKPLPSDTRARKRWRFRLESSGGGSRTTFFKGQKERCAIGSSDQNDVVLNDPTVSRFHCEIISDEGGVRIVDLGSTNGTHLAGVRIKEAFLEEEEVVIRLGNQRLLYVVEKKDVEVPLWEENRYGSLVGQAEVMRELFFMLDRCAKSDASVLLIGESGVGKEGAARAIHEESDRGKSGKPFRVVNCGAIVETLMESELFGHVKEAFTGATKNKKGLFREADGGTLFLDEVGELPLSMQPKLLRALQEKEVRPVGSDAEPIKVDVRVVAATNRDLRLMVNRGEFREDLYYRLNVLTVSMPSFEERKSADLTLLIKSLLDELGIPEGEREHYLSDHFLTWVRRRKWPGNIRELKNAIQRHYILGNEYIFLRLMQEDGEEPKKATAEGRWPAVKEGELWSDYKDRTNAERTLYYLRFLREMCGTSRSRMAEHAGVTREYVYRLRSNVIDYYRSMGLDLSDEF